MKQTAVEWLVNELKKSKHYQQMINEVHKNSTIVSDILEQAKEMEKEQIKDSFLKGYVDDLHQPLPDDYYDYNAEQYYNETYKKT